ncbi:hypothetical protein EYC80_008969 [Monilinia laxa]|uniref:Uncharacterized protein n=1 Tax=Monilinia laxa TaxID=61186 RepID=A0A5N6K229_MONLA|nr:hypothetical protein EYC80_008969 [Monilinia laxa]
MENRNVRSERISIFYFRWVYYLPKNNSNFFLNVLYTSSLLQNEMAFESGLLFKYRQISKLQNPLCVLVKRY